MQVDGLIKKKHNNEFPLHVLTYQYYYIIQPFSCMVIILYNTKKNILLLHLN